MLLRQSCEGWFEISIGSGIHHNELPAERARRHLQVCNDRLGIWKGRVRENAERSSTGCHLTEQLQSFRRQIGH